MNTFRFGILAWIMFLTNSLGLYSADLPDMKPVDFVWDRIPTPGQTSLTYAIVTNQSSASFATGFREGRNRITLSRSPSTNDQVKSWVLEYTAFSGPYAANTTPLLPVDIPADIPAGTYYLIYEVNIERLITESDYSNNSYSKRIQIEYPDLKPVSIVWDRNPTAGQISLFHAVITNQTTSSFATGFLEGTDRITLSRSPFTNDLVKFWNLKYTAFSDAHTATPSKALSVEIPAGIPAGPYYLIYEANVERFVPEADYSNNSLSTLVQIEYPDLKPINFLWDRNPTAGQILKIHAVITNQSSGSFATGFLEGTDRITLSRTTSTNDEIKHWDLIYTSFGEPHATKETPLQDVLIPKDVPAGDYFLIYEANVARWIAEEDFVNNTLVKPIAVGLGELVPLSLKTEGTPIAGRPLSVSWSVTNSSTNALAGSWFDQVALATGKTAHSVIAPSKYEFFFAPANTTYRKSVMINLPQVAAGEYFLLLSVDSENSVPEADESQNTLAIPITVTSLPPKIRLISPKTAMAGKICSSIQFSMAAEVEVGSYDLNRVEFLANGVEVARDTERPFRGLTPPLVPGVYDISAKVVDAFGLEAISSETVRITLVAPNKLELLSQKIDSATLVCCMGAEDGMTYTVDTTDALGPSSVWTPFLTNRVTGSLLLFTNQFNHSLQFFRARERP